MSRKTARYAKSDDSHNHYALRPTRETTVHLLTLQSSTNIRQDFTAFV
jgi:hypothetical protein